MASTYSTNLAIELISTGDQSGTWGSTTNNNLGTLIEQAISGYETQIVSDSADTFIAIPNGLGTGTNNTARNMYLELIGTITAPRSVVVPPNKKLYFIYNNTFGGFTVTVKMSGRTGVDVPYGKKMLLVCDGNDVVVATNNFTALSSTSHVVGNPTGGNLGDGTVNATGLYVNGVSVGSGSGTVTSVSGAGTVNGITLTGSVTNSGFLTLGGALSNVSLGTQVTGTLPIFNGGTGQATANGALNSFLPTQTSNANKFLKTDGTNTSWAAAVTSVDVSGGTTGLTTSGGPVTGSGTITLAGTLAVANGGTGVTTSTGSGSVVRATSPTLVTPVLGTPSSGNLGSCTVDGTNSIGYLNIPQNAQATSYSLVNADRGKHIYSVNTGAQTITVPANSTTAIDVGAAITIINNGTTAITFSYSSPVNIYKAGVSAAWTTGGTLAVRGMCTLLKVDTNLWFISGAGLS